MENLSIGQYLIDDRDFTVYNFMQIKDGKLIVLDFFKSLQQTDCIKKFNISEIEYFDITDQINPDFDLYIY